MSEIFLQSDLTDLMNNRFIVIVGDSIQRAVYKDIVMLLQRNKYLTERDLRSKGEMTFHGDELIEGGQYGEMTNGVRYREVRQYQTDHHLIRFYFVTRCYNGYVESILSDLKDDPLPDVFVMNSCLWDISRYGSSSVTQYKKNLSTLFKRLSEVLPKSCLVIWNMTLPISKKARGGVLIPEVEHLNVSLRLDILEANFFVHKLALQYGFNTLDLHFYLRHQLQRRAGDGVHWDMTAHRRITNLILTHITEAWSVKQPNNAGKTLLGKKPSSNQPLLSEPNMMHKNYVKSSIEQKPRQAPQENFNFRSNNGGQFSNGQFGSGQFDNGQFGNGQFGSGQFDNGQFGNSGQFNSNNEQFSNVKSSYMLNNTNNMKQNNSPTVRGNNNINNAVNRSSNYQPQFNNNFNEAGHQTYDNMNNQQQGFNENQYAEYQNNCNNEYQEEYTEQYEEYREPEPDQQYNIQQYGGPIHRSDFSGVDMSNVQYGVSQVNMISQLGPYRNDTFVPNVRRNPNSRTILGPYNGFR
ncbi:PC-esterase domain-containing protein [Mactra antiquata]